MPNRTNLDLRQVKHLREIVSIRANLYRFFSSIFLTPPATKLLLVLKKNGFLSEMENIFGNDNLSCIRDFLKEDSRIDDLICEYNDLLKVPQSKYLTPFESCFVDEREIAGKRMSGLLMGPSAIAVKREYDNFGLNISSLKELPDHIGIELLYMYKLCEKEKNVWKRNNIKRICEILILEKDFLSNHLENFANKLCKKMFEKTTSNFYKGISTLTKTFIDRESKTFLQLIN